MTMPPSSSQPADKQSHITGLTGGCVCGAIRYRLTQTPLFVHCCHCTYCQRESGSAFLVNALIEASYLELLPSLATSPKSPADLTPKSSSAPLPSTPMPLQTSTPANSGIDQLVSRCPFCYVALWGDYGGVPVVKVVRAGTLDNPHLCPPSIHIFVGTKQAWVNLDSEEKRGAKICKEYYDRTVEWPKESLERREKIAAEIASYEKEANEKSEASNGSL